jgi:signal transduction histidine kinase/CheY-like chemotaxis protein
MSANAKPPRTWQGEAKYQALFDAIDEGFCVLEVLFDEQGRPYDYVFVEVNPSFERQTGLMNAEGRSMRSLAEGHEEHWFQTYGEVARTGNPVRFEAPAEALGRWYDVYAFRVGEPGQNLVAVLFNDVSPRKQLERSLDAQNIALREADARKDRFIATLSHELRNPLSPLKVAAELLSHPGVTEKQLRRTGDIVRRQVAHMGRLLDDLLDVSRITQGKLTLRRERVKQAELIDAAVESVRPLIERKQHVLEIDLDPASPALDVDSVRISQVVANLLNNAAKYTDAGGRITLRTKVEGDTLVLQVCDNGIGLAPEALSSVFEMFEQQNADSERAEGGLGIGLALVKGLVELHGGSVAAESEGPGRGSRFMVRLPIAPAAPDHEADAAPERGESKRRRVLVADDNRDAAESLAMLLDVLGHDVRVAFDGQSALALARVFQPDLAVLDLGMPKMSGYDLARALRREPWAASLTIVAATGWGDLEARKASKEAGFDRHLTKPVDPEDLDEVLRTQAGGR